MMSEAYFKLDCKCRRTSSRCHDLLPGCLAGTESTPSILLNAAGLTFLKPTCSKPLSTACRSSSRHLRTPILWPQPLSSFTSYFPSRLETQTFVAPKYVQPSLTSKPAHGLFPLPGMRCLFKPFRFVLFEDFPHNPK